MRIGILGGSFDPIHQGHLFLARESARLLHLDQVWFMVARVSPLKQDRQVTSAYHRFAMTAVATRRDDRFLVCDWELHQEGPSYTVRTLDFLAAQYPSHRFCFLAGGDALREIHSWRDCDKLLREYCFAFAPRPGVRLDWSSLDFPILRERIQELSAGTPARLAKGRSYLLPVSPPKTSSTGLRRCLASGRVPSARQLPISVYRYIHKHRLYERQQT